MSEADSSTTGVTSLSSAVPVASSTSVSGIVSPPNPATSVGMWAGVRAAFSSVTSATPSVAASTVPSSAGMGPVAWPSPSSSASAAGASVASTAGSSAVLPAGSSDAPTASSAAVPAQASWSAADSVVTSVGGTSPACSSAGGGDGGAPPTWLSGSRVFGSCMLPPSARHGAYKPSCTHGPGTEPGGARPSRHTDRASGGADKRSTAPAAGMAEDAGTATQQGGERGRASARTMLPGCPCAQGKGTSGSPPAHSWRRHVSGTAEGSRVVTGAPLLSVR